MQSISESELTALGISRNTVSYNKVLLSPLSRELGKFPKKRKDLKNKL
jgi:hypothetical protein